MRYRRVIAWLVVLLGVAWGARAEEGKPFFFIQFSDPQFGFYNQGKDFEQETVNFEFAIATANRLKPAFVVITGDLVNKAGDAGQIAEFQRIAKKLDPAIHLYNVPGNHDVGNTPTGKSIAAYAERFGADHYRFREGSLVGIVLDSALIAAPAEAKQLYEEQEKWLKEELGKAKAEGAKHVVIFQHHPWFLKTADEKDQYFNVPIERRREYLELFKQFGVSHVFAGHLHQEEEAKDGALQMIITGAIGKPLGKSKSGMRIVAVRDGGIEQRWVEMGEVPNKVDPMTWPAGELLKSTKAAAPQP
jgi:3',5'-cyclic AMP phosphodiesterase CpdA